MRANMDAVHEELIRLKEEGLDHIFIADSTLELLKSATKVPSETLRKSTSSKQISDYGKPIPKEPPVIKVADGDAITRMNALHQQVMDCPICNEHLSKHGKIVFGTGTVDANIFFCGEAPGADEEKAGEPFVGPAGKLLTKIIQAMGLSRDEVYIGNILKWRPEHKKSFGNRPPTVEEMNFCLPYLKAQIEIVQPKVIVALGNTAVTGLLGPDPKRRLGSSPRSMARLKRNSINDHFSPFLPSA